MWKATCKCDPNQFVAYPYSDDEGDGVLVEKDGQVTNRFEDGTVGVSLDLQKDAQESADNEGVYCPICGSEAIWEDDAGSPDHEFLRNWRYGNFVLSLYDTHRTDEYGKHILAYVLAWARQYTDAVIFRGDDLHCAPGTAIDSDEAAGVLLSFLSLKPGDTDDDYFKDYTQAQMNFVLEYGDDLAMWAEELEELKGTRKIDPVYDGECSFCGWLDGEHAPYCPYEIID